MYSVFLSSYRNTRDSLGELEKAVETLAAHYFSFSQTFTRVSITREKHGVHVFYFLNSVLIVYFILIYSSHFFYISSSKIATFIL